MVNKIQKPFIPVRVTEDKVKAAAKTDGYVYFTTDTKKIYLDTETERLMMGGNTGIYYANKKFDSSEEL
jgi:hypothetical protein